MPGPIYKLFMAKPTEAWYQLSKEEQDRVMATETERTKQAGVKLIIACDCYWSGEQWMFFGVEEYPDIETVQRVAQLQRDANWERYTQNITVLGTKWEDS